MSIEYELTANKILNEIFNIILDDNLSDTEALEKIVKLLSDQHIKSKDGDHTIH